MTATETPIVPVITDDQVEAINRAREVLEKIANDATGQAWHAPTGTDFSRPRAQNLGRVAGVASMAAHNLFDVLNVASSYGVADLTNAQVHNHKGDEGV